MNEKMNFTQGRIILPLMRFALPVMFAMFLQATYGAVDLLVVGKFALPEDVSAVSTGSMIMMTLANIMTSMSMGTTIYFGQQIGMGKTKKGGEIIGASIALFLVLGLVMSVITDVCNADLAGDAGAGRGV